jgi:hypothetical protein
LVALLVGILFAVIVVAIILSRNSSMKWRLADSKLVRAGSLRGCVAQNFLAILFVSDERLGS